MAELTAVILAAGRGTRLEGENGGLPKGLLPISGKTFITRAIDMLRRSGVTEIVIVTGHEAHHFDAIAGQYPSGVKTVHNPHFATEGTMTSLGAALASLSGPVIVLDADIVYEERALAAIVTTRHENAVVLAEIGDQGDEFLVWSTGRDARVLHMNKDRSTHPDAANGEHIGIMKLGPALVADIEDWVAENPQDAADLPYELCVVPLLIRHAMFGLMQRDLVWTEVDTPAMWRRAQDIILPRLAELDAAR